MGAAGREALVLASASPRRRQLLQDAGIAHEIMAPRVVEWDGAGGDAADVALANARAKAADVAARVPARLVLAADTVIRLDGEILGKPHSRVRARAMLERLSGRRHEVLTAVVLRRCAPPFAREEVVASVVEFRVLSDDEMTRYVEGGEGLDKAGAYGIQGGGGRFVARVEGSFSNVVGLPMERLQALLREAEW